MTASSTDRVILEHYSAQAADRQLDPSSTMYDLSTREIETEAILSCIDQAMADGGSWSRLLEVGCGNGYLLERLRERIPGVALTGIDYSPDMLELAERRGVSGCELRRGDVRRLDLPDAGYDLVVSERCLINVLDEDEQEHGLRELHRVSRAGGYVVLIEAFTDGAENLNRARTELGLEENHAPHHNRWFDKSRFLESIESLFDVVSGGSVPPVNFLSTHYFMSRVLYPAVTRREVLYNTEFVQFFRFLPPQGLYSPIQLFLLRRRGA